jgi:hypothetical protein
VWLSRQCVNDLCQTNPIYLFSSFSIDCSGSDKIEYRCNGNNLEKRITKKLCLADQNKCGEQAGNWELVTACGTGTCNAVEQRCIPAEPHCTSQCSQGQKQCTVTPDGKNGWQSCVYDTQGGCWKWSSRLALCDGMDCVNGECVQRCQPNNYKACYSGSLYWFNSCNQRGDLFQNCGNSTEEDYICKDNILKKRILRDACINNKCDRQISDYEVVTICSQNTYCDVTQKKCVPLCTTHASRRCEGNAVYYYNSCGQREEQVEDCSSHDALTNEYRCDPNGANWTQVKKQKGVCGTNQCNIEFE